VSFNINNQQRPVVHQLSNHLFQHYTTKPMSVQNLLQITDITAFQKTECDEVDGNWWHFSSDCTSIISDQHHYKKVKIHTAILLLQEQLLQHEVQCVTQVFTLQYHVKSLRHSPSTIMSVQVVF